jgi:restriction system protein
MTIPDFQTLMLPVLKYASVQNEHSLREAVEFLANQFVLSEEEKNARLPSGKQPIFYNRVGWARTYLKQAGLLETSGKRNYLRITNRGKEVLRSNPSRVDMRFLEQYPEYVEFRERTREPEEEIEEHIQVTTLTPEESLDAAYRKMREDLTKELLDNIVRSSPEFFENLVVELLVAMGYGGSGTNAARAVGQSGDEGIDGIIDEDKLGLDSIYIQAKKWTDKPVGREEIQRFVGALQGKRARKGIFITASRFTEQARNYAANIEMKVVLIDGKRLADLMIDHHVGVTTTTTYEIKRIDSDYFIETLE